MTVLIDVDGGGYALACEACYDANHGVVGAVSTLTDVVSTGSSMAGNDSSGRAWAARYDPAAGTALGAGCDLGTTLATLAHLLDASLANHAAADGAALLYGGVAPPPSPGGSGRTAIELSVSDPPTAAGGIGQPPSWWHWVAAHLLGMLWPDADTGRLRTVGAGWVRAAEALGSHRPDVDTAASMVADQTSPEVHDAVAAIDEVGAVLRELASAYAAIGHACLDYAQAVEDHHDQIEHELASFVAWTVGIEAAGLLTGLVTAGVGEGVAQGAEASRIALAAAKVRRILAALADVARTIGVAVDTALGTVSRVVARLATYVGAGVERALVKVGLREADETFPELLADARQLQMKYKHGEVFSMPSNYNPANGERFAQLLREFVDAPGTTRIRGTFRRQPVIVNYDPNTRQVVVQALDGTFVSGWKMSVRALHHVMTTGSLGGG